MYRGKVQHIQNKLAAAKPKLISKTRVRVRLRFTF